MPRSNPELAHAMGKRMAEKRKAMDLTQETVADIAGIAYQQYNKAENGKVCLGADSLLRVAAALQVSTDYLLTGKTPTERYPETIAILDKLTDRQLELANRMLLNILELGDK